MLVLVALLAGAELDQAARPQATPVQAAPVAKAAALGPEVDELVVRPSRKEAPEWSRRLNFDVRGAFAPPPDAPYLRQRPTNGCKVMAGGATSFVDENGVAGGLVCVKRF